MLSPATLLWQTCCSLWGNQTIEWRTMRVVVRFRTGNEDESTFSGDYRLFQRLWATQHARIGSQRLFRGGNYARPCPSWPTGFGTLLIGIRRAGGCAQARCRRSTLPCCFHRPNVAEYGSIDVLVNNAGFALAGFAEDVTLDELRRQFETNFFGTVSLTKAVLPVMRKQRSGRIMMLSSISGRSASPALSSYSSSKFALEGYTESLRLELAPLGIDCILIEPGSFETGIWYREENAAAQALNPASPNFERTQRFLDYLQKKLHRRDPREVARLIAHVADVSHPRLRYPIGPDARAVLVLRALLPWKAFEGIISRALKLGK
jgi:NAD(P)-dependent dehydrogenase (short-subunit alcohol dehydrogenase family)